MKNYKFRATIINLDGTEKEFEKSVRAYTKQDAEYRFDTMIRTENQELLKTRDKQYLGMTL